MAFVSPTSALTHAIRRGRLRAVPVFRALPYVAPAVDAVPTSGFTSSAAACQHCATPGPVFADQPGASVPCLCPKLGLTRRRRSADGRVPVA